MNLYDIQTSVHVSKNKTNDFGGYNYRTAEGILSVLKASLPEGASIIVSDTLQEVASKIFVTATATIKMESGESYTAQGHAMHALTKKGMDEAQITGSASSYARKYALCGLLAIDDGSADPDSRDNRQPPSKSTQEKVNEAQTVDDINGLVAEVIALKNTAASLHLHERATALHLHYDKDVSKYTAIE